MLTAGEFNALACFVPGQTIERACMRAWGHEGPRIFLEQGTLLARDIVHEYGHYASFVFGYMESRRGGS